ncbi:lipid A-modifier LpxR family protein [Flavobacterium wongokense]|uniref:lipid A-modifier LpxR family protein n=1 Tax=Flavobacterium wongokense TaxID=2910674 RepID=UPI001F350061|nr:lipid A-modifier LpxR family protein [Flavobacterium sp. WG47]MCF6130897.1 lipid A deacylase LpxR family protein [Flavobacterium sp. WG47]
MKKLIVLLILFQSLTYAQGKEGWQVMVTTENDFLGPNNKDENYTGSLKIEGQIPDQHLKFIPFIRKKGEGINIHRFGIGGIAYTPQVLKLSEVILDDRPYSSLTFVNIGNTWFDTKHSAMYQSEFVIGAMGWQGPGKVQAFIHRNHLMWTDRDIPEGWHNQIGDGGAFILNYNTRGQWGLPVKRKWFQPSVVGKVDVGNYMMNLQGGFKFNLFNINSDILQEYYPNIATVAAAEVKDYTATGNPRKHWRFNVFVEPTLRIVGYNATLEGLMFNDHSAHKIAHSDIERVVFEFNSGFNLTYNDWLYLRYSLVGRGREYEGGKDFHYWGGITVGFSRCKWSHR